MESTTTVGRSQEQRQKDIDDLFPLKKRMEYEYDLVNRELLGEGGFSEVDKVLHLKSNTYVALKKF